MIIALAVWILVQIPLSLIVALIEMLAVRITLSVLQCRFFVTENWDMVDGFTETPISAIKQF